jgi:hypothetical protein
MVQIAPSQTASCRPDSRARVSRTPVFRADILVRPSRTSATARRCSPDQHCSLLTARGCCPQILPFPRRDPGGRRFPFPCPGDLTELADRKLEQGHAGRGRGSGVARP